MASYYIKWVTSWTHSNKVLIRQEKLSVNFIRSHLHPGFLGSGPDPGVLEGRIRVIFNRILVIVNRIRDIVNRIRVIVNRIRVIVNRIRHPDYRDAYIIKLVCAQIIKYADCTLGLKTWRS